MSAEEMKAKWDRWYATLPADLKQKLSLHDFKRLGDCFRLAFGVEKIVERAESTPAPKYPRQDGPLDIPLEYSDRIVKVTGPWPYKREIKE